MRKSEAAVGVEGPAVHRRDAPLLGSVLNSWAIATLLQETVGEVYYITTRIGGFAECPRHSAKFKKHSANTLPSVTLGKAHAAKKTVKNALPSALCRALGKEFTK